MEITKDLAMMDLDAADLDTMNLDTTNMHTNVCPLPGTKAVLMHKLVTLLLDIIWEVRIFIPEVDELTSLVQMQEELDKVKESLQAELLLVNAWCNELRMLDADAINGAGFPMTMDTGSDLREDTHRHRSALVECISVHESGGRAEQGGIL